SSVTPSSVAPSGVSSSTGTPSASPSDGPTPSDLGDPFTTLSGFVDDKSVALEVFPVKRSGELAVLQLRMTVDPAAKDRAQIAQTFDDGNFKTGAEGLDSMDGVELVDGARGKVYLAATDTGRRCLCSQNLGATIVEPGQSVSLDVTFAAPPAAASSVDVRIPAFGTVSSVPVQ
ncbi:MAG: hypothetical protein ABI776_19500, partial [Nocardioidaceae bacterium]